MKMKLNKKILIGIVFLLVIGIIAIVSIFLSKRDKDIIDLGDIMNEQAALKSEEQIKLHSMILRNSTWGSSSAEVAEIEKGNILDISDEKYITCDYETLFDLKFLPTYLFQKDKLVAILYEADLSQENISQLSVIHQKLSVNIHYVYEKLYRENNKWKTGQERKYDTNLWTKSILDGDLTLQSIWNSTDEKVFLLTNNNSYFKFLQKEKDRELNSSMTFLIMSDEYLKSNGLGDLIKIVPENTNDYKHSESSDVYESETESNISETQEEIIEETSEIQSEIEVESTTEIPLETN